MRLVDKNTGSVLAEDVETADSFWSRFRGLMFRRKFEKGEALVFEIPEGREFGVHTFFVFFPIDLVYLDGGMEVIDIETGVSPWSTYSPETESKYLVEFPAGVVDEYILEVGHELEFEGK